MPRPLSPDSARIVQDLHVADYDLPSIARQANLNRTAEGQAQLRSYGLENSNWARNALPSTPAYSTEDVASALGLDSAPRSAPSHPPRQRGGPAAALARREMPASRDLPPVGSLALKPDTQDDGVPTAAPAQGNDSGRAAAAGPGEAFPGAPGTTETDSSAAATNSAAPLPPTTDRSESNAPIPRSPIPPLPAGTPLWTGTSQRRFSQPVLDYVRRLDTLYSAREISLQVPGSTPEQILGIRKRSEAGQARRKPRASQAKKDFIASMVQAGMSVTQIKDKAPGLSRSTLERIASSVRDHARLRQLAQPGAPMPNFQRDPSPEAAAAPAEPLRGKRNWTHATRAYVLEQASDQVPHHKIAKALGIRVRQVDTIISNHRRLTKDAAGAAPLHIDRAAAPEERPEAAPDGLEVENEGAVLAQRLQAGRVINVRHMDNGAPGQLLIHRSREPGEPALPGDFSLRLRGG